MYKELSSGCGEIAVEKDGKEYTLTDGKALFNEDFYSVTRYVAVQSVDVNEVPEKDFIVYRFTAMSSGCGLFTVVLDETPAIELIQNNLIEFLHGKAADVISNYIKEKVLKLTDKNNEK